MADPTQESASTPANESDGRWWVGCTHTGTIFIVDVPPSKSHDYPWHARPAGNVAINVEGLTWEQAEEITRSHNEALSAIPATVPADPTQESESTLVYYFGCIDRPGHFLWERPSKRGVGCGVGPFPNLDYALTPRSTHKQGHALLHHIDGWSALSMHDFTVDSRGKCNSTFVVNRPDLSAVAVLKYAKSRFSEVCIRIGDVTVVES